MATAEETAVKLVEATFDTLQGGKDYQADVAAAIVDQLFGSDPHALVRGIAGIPESMVEMITDGLIKALRDAVKKRIGDTPVETE